MKRLFSGLVLLLLTAAVHASVTTTHSLTVAVEQQTHDDVKALTEWLQSAPQDAVLPHAIAQRGAAAMAEIVAAAEGRVDTVGGLVVDSGMHVNLQPGDILRVSNHVAGLPQTAGVTALIEIVIGQGFASILGRKDLVVPSGL